MGALIGNSRFRKIYIPNVCDRPFINKWGRNTEVEWGLHRAVLAELFPAGLVSRFVDPKWMLKSLIQSSSCFFSKICLGRG